MEKKGKILVVDDDATILYLLETMLQSLGYQIHAADNGEDALRIMDQSDHGFDLLLTDIMMPRMDGYELARSCREKHPGVKVLLMSGLCQSLVETEGNGLVMDFLQKPFNVGELEEKVCRALC